MMQELGASLKTWLKISIFILMVASTNLSSVNADVAWIEVSPEDPVQGDTVEITIKADSEEEVPVEISFTQQALVVDGEYELRLDGVVIPPEPNSFTVRAVNVENLNVSINIPLWNTESAEAEMGAATVSQNNISTGNHDIIIRGDAVKGATIVLLQMTTSTIVTTDQDGFYEFSYDAGRMPLGDFTAQVGGKTEFFTLLAPGSKAPTPKDLEAMPESDAADAIEEMDPEEAADLLGQLDDEKATFIFSLVHEEKAARILEASVDAGLTPEFSEILLKMDEEAAASVINHIEAASVIIFLEALMERDLRSTASIMEAAVSLDVESSTALLQGMETDVLAVLLMEMAGPLSSHGAVASVFENMNPGEALEVVRIWLSLGAQRELGAIFERLNPEILQSIYTGLTVTEREAVDPQLSEATLTGLGVFEPAKLPDLTLSFKTIPSELYVGEENVIEIELFNIGEGDSGSFSLTLEVDDAEVDSAEIQLLATGSRTAWRSSWIPTREGEHRLKAAVDHLNQVAESDEDNNKNQLTILVRARETTLSIDRSIDRSIYLGAASAILAALAVVFIVIRRRTEAKNASQYFQPWMIAPETGAYDEKDSERSKKVAMNR